ncbi:MAG: hypothetical protein WAQ28_06020 [Bacteroidia bacterium]
MKSACICLLVVAIIVCGCKSRKPVAVATPPQPPATEATASTLLLKPVSSSLIPAEAELVAVKGKFQDVTLQKLKEGYFVYNEGACTGCHGVYNIYMYNEAAWKTIIDDMAYRAGISDVQKDAVYKYVLSIKATQPQ